MEYNKTTLGRLIAKISSEYTSTVELALKSRVNRTYISKMINEKLDKPPSPEILANLAGVSENVDYLDLMSAAGYISKRPGEMGVGAAMDAYGYYDVLYEGIEIDKEKAPTDKSGELYEYLKKELGRDLTDADVRFLKEAAKLLPKEIEKQDK